MPWNSNSPDGTVSVKANKTPMLQNTQYIETTMGNSVVGTNGAATKDHFWNVDANLDGHHRFVKSPPFTVGGNPADPVLGGSGCDAVLYVKTTNGRAEWFQKNLANVPYQVTPSYKTGTGITISSTSTFITITDVPANVYGEIFMYRPASQGRWSTVTGFFRSDGTTVYAWSNANFVVGTSGSQAGLEFLNGSGAVDLNIKARRKDSDADDWTYIITYRSL